MKKRLFAALLATAMTFSMTGCTSKTPTAAQESTTDSDSLKIVCTIFPQYDWMRELLGSESEHTDLTLLLSNGVDLHSYQPTAEDVIKISDADLFVYVGGESDFWVEDALASAKNPDMIALNLMDILQDNVKEEAIVEGMQETEHHHDHADGEAHEEDEAHEHEEGEEHEHEEGEEHEHEEGPEYDEHVWLSLKNTETICNAITDALKTLDAPHADTYTANNEAYTAKLTDLDAQYTETVQNGARNTLLFGDRFPFRYLVDDYDLDYYAAFVGCSAETEASFQTIAFLADKTDALQLPVILVTESSDEKIANAIKNNTTSKDQSILVLDSMQSVTDTDIENGETYLSVMQKNLETLKTALA